MGVAVWFCCWGCGAHPSSGSASSPDTLTTAGTPRQVVAIGAGRYRLRLWVTCAEGAPKVSSGELRLQAIAAGRRAAPGADPGLLWGQTDLDLGAFQSCLRGAAVVPEEPIHPEVLVDVLKWNGEPPQPVLLVSMGALAADGKPRGTGIAMWVEELEDGVWSGVWSRWHLTHGAEGHWQAELIE